MNDPVRKSIYPQSEDTWESIAARELSTKDQEEAVGALQSWNLHVYRRARPPADSPRAGNVILPSDVIFVEPPAV